MNMGDHAILFCYENIGEFSKHYKLYEIDTF